MPSSTTRLRPSGPVTLLASQRVSVAAPPEIVFEVILHAGDLVEERPDGSRVVDFVASSGSQTIKTRELVTGDRPSRIDYEWLDGPIPYVSETIHIEPLGDHNSMLLYEGEFSIPGKGPRSWLTRFIAKRRFDEAVLEHLLDGARIAEERASRSRKHPRPADASPPPRVSPRPRARWVGAIAGIVGIGCCVYPVALALLGVATAVEAFDLATDLYGNYAWWFRLGGLTVAAVAIWLQLRKRGECSLEGARRNRGYIMAALFIAFVVYWVFYGITTALGWLA
jgi:hypothetical protein